MKSFLEWLVEAATSFLPTLRFLPFFCSAVPDAISVGVQLLASHKKPPRSAEVTVNDRVSTCFLLAGIGEGLTGPIVLSSTIRVRKTQDLLEKLGSKEITFIPG